MTAELHRATHPRHQGKVEARREALLDIIAVGRPMTVRRVFYQATVRGLVEKAETGYGKVQADLTDHRQVDVGRDVELVDCLSRTVQEREAGDRIDDTGKRILL